MTKIRNRRRDGRVGNFEVGDWVEGLLVKPPIIGRPVFLSPIRATSNRDTWDWFHTSTVVALSEVVRTQNSAWKIRLCHECDPQRRPTW